MKKYLEPLMMQNRQQRLGDNVIDITSAVSGQSSEFMTSPSVWLSISGSSLQTCSVLVYKILG